MNSSRPSGSNQDFETIRKELLAMQEDSATKIKELVKKTQDLENQAKLRDSFGGFQFKDVIFNGTAHADTEITHDLRSADPETVRFIPVQWEFITLPVDPPYIYRNGAANARAWGTGYIILRCNIASAVVRMLLITEAR